MEDLEPSIKLFLFEKLEDEYSKLYQKAQKTGKFISEREVQVEECNSMVPLTRRAARGVMSPLKGC